MRGDTLLARTIVLITAVVIAISLCFLFLQRITIGLPLIDASAEYLAARVRSAAETAASISADPASLPQPDGTSIRLSFATPSDARPWAPVRALYRNELETALRARLGPGLEYRESDAGELVWIRTPETGGRWLGIANRLRTDDVRWLLTGMLVLAATLITVAGAAFARRVTRPLTQLAAGATRLPAVPLDPALTRQGPVEVRHLAGVLASLSQTIERRDRDRELMLGAISHDLRTPLARMRLATEMAAVTDEASRRELETNIDELDAIVGQFIAFARSEGEEPAERQSLDEFARDALAIESLRGESLESRLAAPAEIELRPLAIRRVLTNLIENARRYGAAPITVLTEQDADAVRLLVQDAGPGIAAELSKRALEPFVRLDPQSAVAGTGLGLAIVERVARAHRGRVIFRHGGAGFSIGIELPRSHRQGPE